MADLTRAIAIVQAALDGDLPHQWALTGRAAKTEQAALTARAFWTGYAAGKRAAIAHLRAAQEATNG